MTETYLYSLLSSGLGILIVFAALIILSALMVVLKRIFDRQKEETSVEPARKPYEGERTVQTQDEDLDWLTAAVAAYMVMETEALNAPRAEQWLPRQDERTDPWVSVPGLRKNV